MEDHAYKPIIDFAAEERDEAGVLEREAYEKLPNESKRVLDVVPEWLNPDIYQLKPERGIRGPLPTNKEDADLLSKYSSEWKIVSRHDGGQMYEWHCLGYYSTAKTVKETEAAICLILRQEHKNECK